MAKTPQQKLAEAEAKLVKAQARARRALAGTIEARKAAGVVAKGAPQPAAVLPAAYTDHLMSRATAGDEAALELLRKSGAAASYAGQLRQTLATSTNPGMKAWAAGQLAMLDESFDPDAPLPRGAGSPF